MSVTDHSIYSSYSKELGPLLDVPTTGSHKVRYHAHEDWDFHLDVDREPIDLSLVLPHYRARNQPIHHRMNMFVGADSPSIKLKVCRNFPRSKFYLEVQSEAADITIWLPSDFRGRIQHKSTLKPAFSAGFVNRIMQNVKINEDAEVDDAMNEDDVVIVTRGHITFRMWDVQTCAPENCHKEAFRRMFGCGRKAPETCIDWDFLLED